MKPNTPIVLVNFGGPRNLDEVADFLISLLTDQDVIRSQLPFWLHKILFTRIALKRSKKVSHEYRLMGGKSPIYEDTEKMARFLRDTLNLIVLPFHRYLPTTHNAFLEELKTIEAEEILVFPLFPQFTYATSGSIARFFLENLPQALTNKMQWIYSYATHPSYIEAMEMRIRSYLENQNLLEEDVTLLFSAHGVPENFILTGDIYQKECIASFEAIKRHFPKASSILCYQSQFGKGKWLKPSTETTCKEINARTDRKHIVVVPLSFTSDHIETLVEIEKQYLPILVEQGKNAYRCPALNHEPYWQRAICDILRNPSSKLSNHMLIRHK